MASASLNRDMRAEPPEGSRGRGPGGGKLKAFCPFSYKKWPKVKDFNKNLPPCLRQTASRSHDQS